MGFCMLFFSELHGLLKRLRIREEYNGREGQTNEVSEVVIGFKDLKKGNSLSSLIALINIVNV